jgi:two-component system, OmpR family, phosphate regulon sensor histidine kinase PhoR
MKNNKLNIFIFIGFLAIIGVIVTQLFIINKAFDLQKKNTEEKIFYALQNALQTIYTDYKTDLKVTNQVTKDKNNQFKVNVNYEFEQTLLEYYLVQEFQKKKLDLDFEYAIYNCNSDEMAYSSHINSNGTKEKIKCPECFVKDNNLTYYFVVRFPDISQNYFKDLQIYWVFAFILFLVLIIYVYSVFLLLKQKKYTDLQTDFINNMTHEFKTPLSSILIASNFAKDQSAIKQNDKLAKYNNIVIEQTKKLNQHIEKLLYVAKTDSKQIYLEKTNFNLYNLLLLVKENILLKYENKPVITIHCKEKISLLADEFHTYNIIYNLVENAVKYSKEETQIAIDVIVENKFLEIKITDSGIGIPEQDLPFIFDKFYRVQRPNNKNIEGFGIGLSYVKNICQLHKWKISIKNNASKGIGVSIIINH